MIPTIYIASRVALQDLVIMPFFTAESVATITANSSTLHVHRWRHITITHLGVFSSPVCLLDVPPHRTRCLNYIWHPSSNEWHVPSPHARNARLIVKHEPTTSVRSLMSLPTRVACHGLSNFPRSPRPSHLVKTLARISCVPTNIPSYFSASTTGYAQPHA